MSLPRRSDYDGEDLVGRRFAVVMVIVMVCVNSCNGISSNDNNPDDSNNA